MKRTPLILLVIGFAVFASRPSFAAFRGNGSVSGFVTTRDGKGLVGAIVAVVNQDRNGSIVSLTKSDQHGTYSLEGIAAGSYGLRVSRYGYEVLNSPRVTIAPGKTLTLNFVLQELLDFVSARNDPRNWNIKSVLRSTSDRRLIFRGLPDSGIAEEDGARFQRNGTLNIVSTDLLGRDGYSVTPGHGDIGIVSNFAFAEPVSQNVRAIFSGQLASGQSSIWRVRNTLHYRQGLWNEYKFSFGYGRLNPNRLSAGTLARPALFFSQDPVLRDSGVETLAVGFQAASRLLDVLALEYGVDMSRVAYGNARSVWSPYLQIQFTPKSEWMLRTLMSSRRATDSSIVELPDGDSINLAEPGLVTQIDNKISISQVRHAELAVARRVADDATLEVAFYRDRVDGPGTPFLMTVNGKDGSRSAAAQLRSDQDAQQGLRVAFARPLMESVQGMVAYDYGSASGLADPDTMMPARLLEENILEFIRRSYYHSLTGQLAANIAMTRTQVNASLRWYPGNPISPINLFADRIDSPVKGISFTLRQVLPVPDFIGSAGRWEAMVDIRNPFDLGRNFLAASDGDVSLMRNPRTLRFGLNLNFF